MDNSTAIAFWDEKKNFYELFQEGKNFCVKKDGEVVFESTLLKLKVIEEYPIRPLIMQNKLILYNYGRGMEIHRLDGSGKVFLDVRAVWKETYANNLLFLQKRMSLVTVDVEKEAVVEKIYASESFDIEKAGDCLLFYRFKRNKTFLYDKQTREFTELPKFNAKMEIITKILPMENKLVVFYAAARELENPIGVYIYDLQKQKSHFYCALTKFSAKCHKYLKLLDFSFYGDVNGKATDEVKFDGANYLEYLRFVYKHFGLFAMMYYSPLGQSPQPDDSEKVSEIKSTIEYIAEIFFKLPHSNKEYAEALAEMALAEEKLRPLLN